MDNDRIRNLMVNAVINTGQSSWCLSLYEMAILPYYCTTGSMLARVPRRNEQRYSIRIGNTQIKIALSLQLKHILLSLPIKTQHYIHAWIRGLHAPLQVGHRTQKRRIHKSLKNNLLIAPRKWKHGHWLLAFASWRVRQHSSKPETATVVAWYRIIRPACTRLVMVWRRPLRTALATNSQEWLRQATLPDWSVNVK
jgi:hypothetical protein